MPARSSRTHAAPSSAPVHGPRRTSGLNFSNVLSGDGGHNAAHHNEPYANGHLQDSSAPFAYSRNHLLSLWNEKATAELPADMAASLSALSGDVNGQVNHHHHPAHLVISQDAVGRPLGLSPLSADEEKMYSNPQQTLGEQPVSNGSSVLPDGRASRKTASANGSPAATGLGHPSTAQEKSGLSINGASPMVSRRTSGNTLRSGGAGLTGIQGGVLGSVTSGAMGRRGHRMGEGSEGTMRSPSGQGSKGQGLGETASPLSPELNEPQRVLGAQDRFKSLAPQNQKGAPNAASGTESPPAHWDSEGEEDTDVAQREAARRAGPSNLAAGAGAPQRTELPSRPSLADLAHDSEKVEHSSRRSSTAASLLTDDPLLRRRGFEASQPNSGASTPDPMAAARLRNASPALSHPPGLQNQPSPLKERLEDALWHYQDPSGTLQGPFKGELMQNWYEHQYFTLDLLVRRATPSSSLQPLAALINQVGDRLKPFLTPLPSAQPAPALPPWSVQNTPSPSNLFNAPAAPAPSMGAAEAQYTPAFNQTQDQSAYDPFSSGVNHHYDHQDMLASLGGLNQQQQQQRDPWGVPIQNTEWAQQQQYAQYLQQQQQQQQPRFDSMSMMAGLMGQDQPVAPVTQQLQGRDLNMHPQTLQTLHHPQPSQPWARLNRADSPATTVGVIGAPSTPSIKRSDSVADAEQEQNPASALEKLALDPTPSEPSAQQEPVDKPVEATQDVPEKQAPTPSAPASERSAPSAPKAKVLPAQSAPEPAKPKAKPQPSAQSPATAPEPVAQKEASSSPAPSSASTKPSTAPWASAALEAPDRAAKSPAGPSLREIQAREAKEEEERRAAAKKAKAAALASEQAALAAQAEQEANLPWAQPKSSSSGGGAAWTKPAAPASGATGTKKTLKEIQEEEEARQRKANQQRQAASSNGSAVPAARGYAGSLGPRVGIAAPSNPIATVSSGPWSTVGANGKVNSPAVPKPATPTRSLSGAPAAKPAAASPAPAPAPAARRPASVTPASTASPTSSRFGASPSAKAPPSSEHQPSLEFLEWTRAALKGLTIPIDDFITMLLTFPVQADSSTLEIISDAVYANSRTLDGRRFAEQFALKRKADAGLSTKGKQPSVPAAAPIQLGTPSQPTAAQILQSKAKTEEALNFTVVPSKKGKKGGRS